MKRYFILLVVLILGVLIGGQFFVHEWTKQTNFNGNVQSIVKSYKGNFRIEIIDKNSKLSCCISLRPNKSMTIEIGDSLFKYSNDKLLYIKKSKQNVIEILHNVVYDIVDCP